MFEVSIGGKACKAAVSCLTPTIYEEEFGGDMLADLYGRIDKKSGNLVELDRKGEVVAVDYTAVKWNVIIRVLWAALKTVSDTVPGFKVWAKTADGINAIDVRSELEAAITDCFFRPGPDESEAEGDEEAEEA